MATVKRNDEMEKAKANRPAGDADVDGHAFVQRKPGSLDTVADRVSHDRHADDDQDVEGHGFAARRPDEDVIAARRPDEDSVKAKKRI